jgi:nucleotide-binding universal stress UspA family protein
VTGAVTVSADRSPAGHRALQWAASEARRRNLSLQVVIPQEQHSHRKRHAAFVDALAAVRDAVPGLTVLGHPSHGPVADALRELSAEAAAVVVPSTLPELTAVVADSCCPVVTVPENPPSPEAENGPVVLGAAPWTGEEVISLAFREASDRHAPLLAVRAWSDPGLDLGWLRPDRLARWDRAEERARRELELMLSPWTVIHPDVSVERLVVQDRRADILVALSQRARLLVLGRSARGAPLAGIAGSPVELLIRAAGCPVAVVPAAGPPRTTWLPSRIRGWAFTGR